MIKKNVITAIIIIILYLFQTTIFRTLELAGVVPNLLLVVTVTYGYLRGRSAGIVIGFFCGLFVDMQYGTVVGLYAFILMSIGFFVGYCKKIYFRNSLVIPIILIVSSGFIYDFYSFFTEFLLRGRLNFGYFFIHKMLPDMLYTSVIGICLFKLLEFLEKKFLTTRKEI